MQEAFEYFNPYRRSSLTGSGPELIRNKYFSILLLFDILKDHKNFSGAWIELVEEAEAVPLSVIAFIGDFDGNYFGDEKFMGTVRHSSL